MSFAMRTLTLAALLALTAPATAALTPGDSTRTLDHGGRTRQYLLHVPASYDGATAVPLVLDFHGFGSNAIQQRGISGMVAVSNREGFLLAHPDGINMTWNAGTCCGNFQIDDVGFIRTVTAAIVAEGNVDQRRIYVTGLSNGGAITQRLACDAADLFAAAAPMAFPIPARPLSECHPVRSIPVLTFMGLTDVLVEYDNGGFGSAPNTFDYWHDVDGCSGTTPDETVVMGKSRCETYKSCAAGVEAGLCSITARSFGGAFFDGHILYLNDDFVLAEVAWAFLSRFSLPEPAPSFVRGELAGTTRLARKGQSTIKADATWQVGVGAGTWWAMDAGDHAFAGSTKAKGKRRKLAFTSDSVSNLVALLATSLATTPENVVLDGEPQLTVALGRRLKLSGVIHLGGANAGTFRVKLAGARQ
jgi:polyhydroxybutyrate depolymerase